MMAALNTPSPRDRGGADNGVNESPLSAGGRRGNAFAGPAKYSLPSNKYGRMQPRKAVAATEKADPGRDEYDVKKQVGSLHPARAPRPHAQNPRASRAQVEVLGEYQAGRTDEFERLKKYRDDLHVFLVRPPRRLGAGIIAR